jgi:2-octaprenyl-6-methoxyphenol hydroxylase
MLHDLVIVGTGPVGATLALALREGGLDIVALDARQAGAIGRGDRSLALSHGARLIFERLGVWAEVTAATDAVTPITSIDISQRGGFGMTRLAAEDHRLSALGYVVSYRALQHALDAALARAGIRIEYGVAVHKVDGTPAYATVAAEGNGIALEWQSRLVAVADGGGEVAGIARRRHDYRQVALVAKVWTREPHCGVAFERFTSDGPMALLPEGEHYGLVWTAQPEEADRLIALPEPQFLELLQQRFGLRVRGFERAAERKSFPLTLEFAERVTGERTVLLGNAAQALHPVAGQGFNLGLRDAYELAQELLDTDRDQIGARDALASYAKRRRTDRGAGIAFTHALLAIFGSDTALLRWPRGLALTLLDALPPVKRMFARTMLFGIR